jgi:hypothetical protein
MHGAVLRKEEWEVGVGIIIEILEHKWLSLAL